MILLTFVALAAAAPSVLDPLAPAREGLVQCYGAHVERKTCDGIGVYRFGPDGEVTNTSANIVSREPVILLSASSKVYIRGEAECSMVTDHGSIITALEVDGVSLEGDPFERLRNQIADTLKANLGTGEYCTTYSPRSDGTLLASVTVNGIAMPQVDSIALWVRPTDGWRVAP